MNFFRGAKKPEKTPACRGRALSRLAPERPPRLLCQTPARPFLHARGGTALSFFFQRAELPFLPRQGQVLFAFPAGGRHGPCLVPGKKARLCPVLPFCRARGKGCTPWQKQKARPPPKGWPDRCVSLSGDEAQVSDQALGLPNWQSLLPESEVHISSMFRGSL